MVERDGEAIVVGREGKPGVCGRCIRSGEVSASPWELSGADLILLYGRSCNPRSLPGAVGRREDATMAQSEENMKLGKWNNMETNVNVK